MEEIECNYHYQAGGKCHRQAVRLVENEPFCETHASVILWRLLQQGKKFAEIDYIKLKSKPYEPLSKEKPTHVKEKEG